LIRKQYAYENQYLVNAFNRALHLPRYATLSTGSRDGDLIVHSVTGKQLFAFSTLEVPDEPLKFDSGSWLYVFSFLLFLVAVMMAGNLLLRVSRWMTFVFTLLIIAARALTIHLHIPDEFYSTPLFSPQLYASSFYFNSLGDLL